MRSLLPYTRATLVTLFFLAAAFRSANLSSPMPPDYTEPIDGAAQFLERMLNWGHHPVYAYANDNDVNTFIPHLEGTVPVDITHCSMDQPPEGRSNGKIRFHFVDTDAPFAIWRYTNTDQNFGQHLGLDLFGTETFKVFVKGSGNVELLVGGTNRPPFYDSKFPHQDGLDVRSSGLIQLTEEWKEYTIDLTNKRFWVFRDSMAGANNKFSNIALMGNHNLMPISTGYVDDTGRSVIRIDWGGDNARHWGGGFFFAPEQSWNSWEGYNLQGIKSIHFKAKSTAEGKLRLLFGKSGDSAGELKKDVVLGTDWAWYSWELPPDRDYSNVVGGFGWALGGNLQTPPGVVFLDSIYYEGIELKTDLSQVITGFAIAAAKSLNPDSASVYFDAARFDADLRSEPRFGLSFITLKDTLDWSQRTAAHTYDNTLLIQAFLALFKHRREDKFLQYAMDIGDAFLYAMNHDPYLPETNAFVRNVYAAGLQPNWDGTMKLPGWYDEEAQAFYQDKYYWGMATGNIAWTALALISLHEFTNEARYLEGAETLAQWCLDHTGTAYGFTGGMQGWPDQLQDVSWKSTEHVIDLFAVFERLHQLTGKQLYAESAENARYFVYSMWNEELDCFNTGTGEDGQTPNTSNFPLDVQSWYVQAFRDFNSPYTACMQWGLNNCYLEDYISPNYEDPVSGFDYNQDRDGIWLEGTFQAALSYWMLGQTTLADAILQDALYFQDNGPNHDGLGFVAADHDHVSTGFDWEYHNRLATAASAWFVFAALRENPYHLKPDSTTDLPNRIEIANRVNAFPNPFEQKVVLEVLLLESDFVEVSIFDLQGRPVAQLVDIYLPAGDHRIDWNADGLPPGCYLIICKIAGSENVNVTRMVKAQ